MRDLQTLTKALASITVAAALAACGPGDRDTGAPQETEAPQETPAATTAALPDTTAQAVWSYLQEVGYDEAWSLWPEMGAYYTGGQPHGRLLTTYVNAPALEAIREGDVAMPTRAFLVKENYTPDSSLVAVTAMYKTDGYDSEHGDWFWAKYQPDGTVDAAGRVTSCQDCHADGNDYVLTDDFGAPGDG